MSTLSGFHKKRSSFLQTASQSIRRLGRFRRVCQFLLHIARASGRVASKMVRARSMCSYVSLCRAYARVRACARSTRLVSSRRLRLASRASRASRSPRHLPSRVHGAILRPTDPVVTLRRHAPSTRPSLPARPRSRALSRRIQTLSHRPIRAVKVFHIARDQPRFRSHVPVLGLKLCVRIVFVAHASRRALTIHSAAPTVTSTPHVRHVRIDSFIHSISRARRHHARGRSVGRSPSLRTRDRPTEVPTVHARSFMYLLTVKSRANTSVCVPRRVGVQRPTVIDMCATTGPRQDWRAVDDGGVGGGRMKMRAVRDVCA